jgi:hypothetical protein
VWQPHIATHKINQKVLPPKKGFSKKTISVCQRTLNKNFHEKGSSVLSQNKAPNGVQEEEEEESQEEEEEAR